jgi:hypothetical protein
MRLGKRKNSDSTNKPVDVTTIDDFSEDLSNPETNEEKSSTRLGMHPEFVAKQQANARQLWKRRNVTDGYTDDYQNRSQSLLKMALSDQDDRFKAKVYDLVLEYGIEPDDPLFLVLLSTGRLEVLMEEKPQELSALFDQWENRIHDQLDDYKQGLETYERTAVKAQEKAIAQSVTQLIQGTVMDKFIHSFTLASVSIAAVLGLSALSLGGWAGYQLHAAHTKAIKYAPGQPRQLTQAEAEALEWATSNEGSKAKDLLEWNKDLLYNNACEAQTKQLGLTLTLEGQKAKQGACVLWVRPIEQRQLEPVTADKPDKPSKSSRRRQKD